MNSALHSSATDLWNTPDDLFVELDQVFDFTLDPCSDGKNAKCARFFTAKQDGLAQDWGRERVFMNPPYGDAELPCPKRCKKVRCQPCDSKCAKKHEGKSCPRRGHCITEYRPGIADWMRKAYEASLTGALVVCLVPSRTGSAWWKLWAEKGERHFFSGRLRFGGTTKSGKADSAPFDSALVIFYPASFTRFFQG